MIVFENKGEADLRALMTFGTSVKETDNPIGFFGTGFKYALAVLLREGHEITLIIGNKQHVIHTIPMDIRGKHFDMIAIDGKELNFTTELGKTWKIWEAYRELHCNALDEAGEIYATYAGITPIVGKTYVCVNGAGIDKAYDERHKYILPLDKMIPIFSTHEVDIFAGASKALYYRGIRVRDIDKGSNYTYSIKEHLDLTENRTLSDPFYANCMISRAICSMDNTDIIEEMLTGNGFESALTMYSTLISKELLSEAFCAVMERYVNRVNDINVEALDVYLQHFPKDIIYKECELSMVQNKQLDKAITVCQKLGAEFSAIELIITPSLGESTLGLAKGNKIVIALRCFDMGTKALASTLYEEWVHVTHGFQDHTYNMQTFLFDKIMTLQEEVQGEPI